jgi:hypothetical protein
MRVAYPPYDFSLIDLFLGDISLQTVAWMERSGIRESCAKTRISLRSIRATRLGMG